MLTTWQFTCMFFFTWRGLCDCGTYGTDYVHGGTYCIDTRKNDFFEFGTAFFGCTPDDTQGGVEPILVAPNNDNFLCSVIPTNPDDTAMMSTCNVTDNVVRKNQMTSGTWSAVLEGLTFAYQRSFDIIAGPPVEVTNTPTMTVIVSTTPLTTMTSTTTSVIPTTLAQATVTKPATTSTVTKTVTPKRVISTTTNIKTITVPAFPPVITKTTVTKTITTSCKVAPRRNDPIATIHPPKASLAAAIGAGSRIRRAEQLHRPRAAHAEDVGALARRTPDLCTTTVEASTTATTTSTSTASTSTITSTAVETSTSTM
jgi:hypothetical protein